tara:strand:- start:179 stop:568 length:390 start_codon:yes stop_codon:yes gene_type:complete
MAYIQNSNPFKKNGVIKKGRKKHARSIREHGHYVEGQEPGTESTHLMESDIKDNPTGTYHVWPSITTDKEGAYDQTPEQAYEAGEMYQFKNKKKAEKFAYGSWKKGKDRREAMKDYREMKRKRRKNKKT